MKELNKRISTLVRNKATKEKKEVVIDKGHSINAMSLNELLSTYFSVDERKGIKKHTIAFEIMDLLNLKREDYYSSDTSKSVTDVFCDLYTIDSFIRIYDELYKKTRYKNTLETIKVKLILLGVNFDNEEIKLIKK